MKEEWSTGDLGGVNKFFIESWKTLEKDKEVSE